MYMRVQCPRRTEEGAASPGAEVTGLSEMGARTQVLARVVNSLKCLLVSLAPPEVIFTLMNY